jgi:hypothetical protein
LGFVWNAGYGGWLTVEQQPKQYFDECTAEKDSKTQDIFTNITCIYLTGSI